MRVLARVKGRALDWVWTVGSLWKDKERLSVAQF